MGSEMCIRDSSSYSGPESQAQRRIAKGDVDIPVLCQWTLATVWDGLRRMMDQKISAGSQLVAAGGVMSNRYLRQQLKQYCAKKNIQFHLAPDGYSADNSSGAAFWAAWQEGKE